MPQQAALPTVTVSGLAQRPEARERAKDAFELWDIREPHEWLAGTIPGARLTGPPDPAEAAAKAAEGVEVILYCQGGVRSGKALPSILALGGVAKHLEGGFASWVAEEAGSR